MAFLYTYIWNLGIRYDCKNSRLKAANGQAFGYWIDSNNLKQLGWGGSDGYNRCACGKDRKCYNDSTSCNCDAGDNVWRRDAGLLLNKNSLPVKKVKFSDINGSSKLAKFRLGSLICGVKQFCKHLNTYDHSRWCNDYNILTWLILFMYFVAYSQCSSGFSDCDSNAICTSNPWTGVKCVCKPGFYGNGRICKGLLIDNIRLDLTIAILQDSA